MVTRMLVTLCLLVLNCAPYHEAVYVDEPDCGRPDAVHAIADATCDGSIQVACSCDDRSTLRCVDGSWRLEHDGCPAVGVTPEQP